MTSLRSKRFSLPAGLFIAILVALTVQMVATAIPASANLEITATACNGRDRFEAPGQDPADPRGNETSTLRALWATGFLQSIEYDADLGGVVVTWDPTIPSSKRISSGSNFTIPGGAGGGLDLILSPGLFVDGDFPAFSHCANLN